MAVSLRQKIGKAEYSRDRCRMVTVLCGCDAAAPINPASTMFLVMRARVTNAPTMSPANSFAIGGPFAEFSAKAETVVEDKLRK